MEVIIQIIIIISSVKEDRGRAVESGPGRGAHSLACLGPSKSFLSRCLQVSWAWQQLLGVGQELLLEPCPVWGRKLQAHLTPHKMN